MNKFSKISVINVLNLPTFAVEEIKKYSLSPIEFPQTDSDSEEETLKRIGSSDAALGSWNTKITPKIIDSCPKLKYIGICGTSLTYVDCDYAQSHGVTVKNVTDYGDEATAEFIFGQLLSLARGFNGKMWDNSPRELNNKMLGVIGLGAVGKHVARIGLGFGMKVCYSSRSRNQEYESRGLKFLSLQEVLKNSDVISIHTPRDLQILGEIEFEQIKPGSILVNTSIGNVFDMTSFRDWISKEQNYVIIDNQSYINELMDLKNVIALPISAGKTQESLDRLGLKVIENIDSFLSIKKE